MWVGNIFAGLECLILGIIIRFFKVSGLIAGYNTMPKSEKGKVDQEKLTRYVGNMLFISATILLLAGLLNLLGIVSNGVVILSWILTVIVIIGGVIYINTGDRVEKEK